jgi:hypothetical protein
LPFVIDKCDGTVIRVEPERAFYGRGTGPSPDNRIEIRIEIYARCPTAEGNAKQELIWAARSGG